MQAAGKFYIDTDGRSYWSTNGPAQNTSKQQQKSTPVAGQIDSSSKPPAKKEEAKKVEKVSRNVYASVNFCW